MYIANTWSIYIIYIYTLKTNVLQKNCFEVWGALATRKLLELPKNEA